MKRIAILLLLLASTCSLFAREVININSGWKFSKTGGITSSFVNVDLPHTWNSDMNREMGELYFGTGSYLKEVPTPSSWMDKRTYIRFKGVSSVATVFINGKYAGTHKGAFTSFTLEITPFLNYGTYNSILVVANNSTNMDVMPLGADMTLYGGIYRDVDLIVAGSNHIALSDYGSEGVYLTQTTVSKEIATVDARIKIDGRIGSQIGVRVDVKNGGQYVAGGESTTTIETNGRAEVVIPITITAPRLWNGVYDPFMYNVSVSTTDDLGGTDAIEIPLGLRTFSVDREKGFFLNGEPYKIRGVLKNQDRSGVGSAMVRRHHEEDVALIAEMGATAVRLAGAPQDQYVYELCDKAGLIVWSDMPFSSNATNGGKGFLDSYDFRENGETQLIEMIRQNYNNPSVALWGIFDKISSKGDDCRPYVGRLNDIAHSESSDRLTVGVSIEDGEINQITDLVSWAQFFGWEVGEVGDFNRWADQFKKDWQNIKPGVGEYGAGANIFQQSDSLFKPNVKGGIHPENWQNYFHEKHLPMIAPREYFWGSFIHSMFDYTNPFIKQGGMNGICDYGLITWDRHTKKDAFYFYKANWNTLDPFVYITERRNSQRSSPKQIIKIYTNLNEAELFVNGESKGIKPAKEGTILWNDVLLVKGRNSIEVRSGRTKDETTIELIKQL